MQAGIPTKLYFYTATIVVNICLLVLAWQISPLTIFKHTESKLPAAPTVQAAPVKQTITGKPVRVVINEIGLDLPVADGAYNPKSGEWTIGNHKAYYATLTSLLNDTSGTTLIYGHNNRTAFRKLRYNPMAEGTELRVYADNGRIFHYAYSGMTEVKPENTKLITETGRPTVILQTCTGNWNQWRRMFMFDFKSVESPPTR